MFDEQINLTEAEMAARAALVSEALDYYHQERARLQAEARQEADDLAQREGAFFGASGAADLRTYWNDAALVLDPSNSGSHAAQADNEGVQA